MVIAQNALHLKLSVCNSLKSLFSAQVSPQGRWGGSSVATTVTATYSHQHSLPNTAFIIQVLQAQWDQCLCDFIITQSQLRHVCLSIHHTLPEAGSSCTWPVAQMCFSNVKIFCPRTGFVDQFSSQSFELHWPMLLTVPRTRAEAKPSQFCRAKERGWWSKGRLNIMCFNCWRFHAD